MKYPNGVLVEHDEQIYRVSDDKLYPLASWRAVLSWGQPIVSADFVYDYEISETKIGFRPTSVIQSVDGKSYFIDGNKKRYISTPDFWDLGFNEFESIKVSDEELAIHKDGEPIV